MKHKNTNDTTITIEYIFKVYVYIAFIYYIEKGCVVCALCHDLVAYGRRKEHRKNIS